MSPNDHSAFLLILSCTALAVSLSQAYSQAKRPQPVIVLAPQSQRATTLPISANELARRRVQGIKTVILPLSWKHIEPKRAQFDWKLQDHSLAIVQKSRLGWIASWNMLDKTQLPEWFAGKFDAQYRRCIEHGREGQEQSPWNPILRQHIARVLGAFGAKYRKTPPNTLLLDLPDLPQNPTDKQGHAHSGYWGGDQFAVSNFQAWLFRRYGGSSPLRDAWGELPQSQHPYAFCARTGSQFDGMARYDPMVCRFTNGLGEVLLAGSPQNSADGTSRLASLTLAFP